MRLKDPLHTSLQAGSHISLTSLAQCRPPARKQPHGAWEGRGGTGDVLLGRVTPLSQGLPRCHLKAMGWHSTGCEQAHLGCGCAADLPVTASREAPTPLTTCSKIPWVDRRNKKGFAECRKRGQSRPTVLCGEHACRKANVSHFLYTYCTPTSTDAIDLSHQSCESHLSPSEES